MGAPWGREPLVGASRHARALARRLTPERRYGAAGYFLWRHRSTSGYTYANWGSRPYEYFWATKRLRKLRIRGRQVIDIGIGLPTDSDFYRSYVGSGCYLTAFDSDGRLDPVTQLSERCAIIGQSAEVLPLEDGSVDFVVALSSLEHFPLPAFERTISEIHRTLRDDGSLLVTLDLTFDHPRSAGWAVLEKTLHGLPAEENELPLPAGAEGLTLERFLALVHDRFVPVSSEIRFRSTPLEQRVHDTHYNSMPAYAELVKVPAGATGSSRSTSSTTRPRV